jgi:hypothetical protein
MNRRTAVIASATIAFLPILPLRAQLLGGDNRILRLGFAGGVIVPRTGATLRTFRTGVTGQGFLLLQLPGGLPAIRLNADYAKMDLDQGLTSGTANRTILDAVAGLKLNLIPGGPIRPYVLAGVGAFNIKDVLSATASTSAGLPTTNSMLNVGIDGGAGISIKLWHIDAVVETRLQNVWTKQGGLIDTKSIQSFPVSFGILF